MNEEPMTQEQRADLVSYYFERAHDSIAEAKYLRDGGYYNGALTRLYVSHRATQPRNTNLLEKQKPQVLDQRLCLN